MSFPVQHDNIVTPFSHLLETTFFKTSKGFKKDYEWDITDVIYIVE